MRIINVYREGGIRFPFKGVRKKDIMRDAEIIARVLELKNTSISIIILDNNAIRRINNRYRKKNSPTDVISFAERDMPFPRADAVKHLGDVYISLERAWQQYRDYSESFREEVRRLLVHGILHLMGYDHEKSMREERKMEKKEEWLIKKLLTSEE